MRRVCTLLLLSCSLLGCPDVEGACETDRYGCSQDTSDFMSITDGCPTSPLTVTVGYGRTEFTEFETAATVPFEEGPQGGQHTWLALEADGVAIDITGKLKTFLRLWKEVEPGCMQPDQADEAAGCRKVLGSRNVLLGGAQPINVVDGSDQTSDGVRLVKVSEFGLVVFLDEPYDAGSAEVTIEDECGRLAKAIHWIGGAGPK